jgi:pseudo-rSAM protein
MDKENKKSGPGYWLYLHPYVYVSVKKDRAVLYNTLNYKMLEYPINSPMFKLIKRLNTPSNLYVIKIGEIDSQTSEFVNQIRRLYFGDVIDIALSKRKPIQFKPILNLQKTLDSLSKEDGKSRVLSHDEIPDYLNSMTLYINNYCRHSCSICHDGYKQFPCCHKGGKTRNRVTREHINTLLDQVKTSTLHKLTIIGGDIFAYPGFEDLVEYLNGASIIKAYHFFYLHIEDRPGFFKLMKKGNNKLVVTAHFPLDTGRFADAMGILSRSLKTGHFEFQFVVQNEADIESSEALVSKYRIDQYQLVPYFNGGNLDFFHEYVFLDRESIVEGTPEMNDILARGVLNTSDFKKLTILSDLSVHANLNHPKIGKLAKNHIMELIYKELHQGKSWTKIRKHVKPCKSCSFNALCPPISNYEYAIGQYNLCHIMQ